MKWLITIILIAFIGGCASSPLKIKSAEKPKTKKVNLISPQYYSVRGLERPKEE